MNYMDAVQSMYVIHEFRIPCNPVMQTIHSTYVIEFHDVLKNDPAQDRPSVACHNDEARESTRACDARRVEKRREVHVKVVLDDPALGPGRARTRGEQVLRVVFILYPLKTCVYGSIWQLFQTIGVVDRIFGTVTKVWNSFP